MTMIRLVYFSKASGLLDQADLLSILESSRRNNAQTGIKGLLLFVNGVFVQVLEGPAATVRSLVTTLEKDPRHSDIRVVFEEEITKPLFADWTMAYLNADLTELLKAAGLANTESAIALFAAAESRREAGGAHALNDAISRAVSTFAGHLRSDVSWP